ncbi:MAG: 50S ribosomal protein L24 [Gammaproteobacteria bacterium]|nr:50S ribosomal protein L24 [Gammaproteobacteria bacterium]
MAKKIKTGDLVYVLAGKSKGHSGKILRIYTKTNRVLVEGANLVKKHVKPNPQQNEQGGIREREASIHISNVALSVPPQKGEEAKLHSKVGFKTLDDGRKVRYFKHNNEIIEA